MYGINPPLALSKQYMAVWLGIAVLSVSGLLHDAAGASAEEES
jgi:hypothetical protein